MSSDENSSAWACCPVDLLEAVLCSQLSARDVAAAACVCQQWRAAADRSAPWARLCAADFPAATPATLEALGQRSGGARGGARRTYRALSARWTCDRCHAAFTDGANTATACCFHPGILFSGGLMNGEALRFTCCNARAHLAGRDSNGCTRAYHAGGGSAWQRHGTGVQPREPSAEPAGAGPGSSSSGGSSGSGGAGGSSGAGSRGGSPVGSPPRVPYPFVNAGREAWAQEWHPNARPGLLELPSRLFSSSGGGGV